MNILSNHRNNINILLFLITLLYLIKLLVFPLPVQTGGSELNYWAYFQDYLNLFKNFEFEYMQNYRWFPQEWRWGFYIFPLFLNIFFDNINILYLTGSICIFLSFIIFLITIKKFYSILPIIFFIITWILHPDIEKFTYSFSTNSLSILVISIISYFLSKVQINQLQLKEFFVLLFLFFWLYGIKEANIIFVTFIPLIFFLNRNLKHFYLISLTAIGLYVLETIFIYIITDGQNSYGRFFYHFISSDSYAWVKHVTSEELRWGSPQFSVKNLSREFLDGGIFSRWFFTGLTFNFFYIFALIKAFININQKKNNFIYNLSLLYLCYFFTLSFSLVEIFPPKPLIHFNLGIQVLGFPLALIIFIDFLDDISKDFKNKYLFLSLFLFISVLLNLKSLNHVKKVSLKLIKDNNYDMFTFDKTIIKVSEKINNSNCIYVKGPSNHLIYIFGEKYLEKDVIKSVKNFIIEDVDEYIDLISKDEFYKIKIKNDCNNDNSIKLKKFKILN